MSFVCSSSKSRTRHMTGLISGVWRPSQHLELLFLLPETLHDLVLLFSHFIFLLIVTLIVLLTVVFYSV